MNKQGPKLAAIVGCALLAGSLGIFLAAQGPASARAAAVDKEVTAAILKIAESIKKGDKDDAKKQAAALATKVDDLEDVMGVFKPRKKKALDKSGVGVGKTPGAIIPDGIEQMLSSLGRDAPSAAALGKQAEDLEEMGYVIAAVMEVTAVKVPKDLNAKKTKKDWLAWSAEARAGAAQFNKAAKAKGAQDVKTAASKIEAACNSCHTAFRN